VIILFECGFLSLSKCGIFHLLFLDWSWPWETETMARETTDGGGEYNIYYIITDCSHHAMQSVSKTWFLLSNKSFVCLGQHLPIPSTTSLLVFLFFVFLESWESNPGPYTCQASTVPASFTPSP
jgi:hypothetical protein